MAEEHANPYAIAPDSQPAERDNTDPDYDKRITGAPKNHVTKPTKAISQTQEEVPSTMATTYCDKSECRKVMVPTNPG